MVNTLPARVAQNASWNDSRERRRNEVAHSDGGVPLVHIADNRIRCHGINNAPAGNPENQLLQQADFAAGLVEPPGDTPVGRADERAVGVEKIERDAADLRPPDPQNQSAPGQVERDLQPRAVGTACRADRQRTGIVGRIALVLPSAGVDDLSEVPFASIADFWTTGRYRSRAHRDRSPS